MKRGKISFFLPSLRGGGAERATAVLSSGLAEYYPVDLVLSRAEGPFLKWLSPGVRVIDFKKSRVLTSTLPLARYLREEKPRVLISGMTHANIIALWAKALAKVKTRVFVVEHTNITQVKIPFWEKKFFKALMKSFYPSADVVIALTEDMKLELRKILPSVKINVIPNPVVNENIYSLSREPLTHPWFSPKKYPVVLAVGRLTSAKGFDVLLKAFSIVLKGLKARLFILGEGPLRGELETLARQLEIEDWVEMPGFVHNPYKFMARSDLFVLSSRWEGLPTVLIEALSLNLPVVSTDCVSGPREILKNGMFGKLVPVEDYIALAKAIEETLKERPIKDYQEAIEPFILENVMNKYISLIEGVE